MFDKVLFVDKYSLHKKRVSSGLEVVEAVNVLLSSAVFTVPVIAHSAERDQQRHVVAQSKLLHDDTRVAAHWCFNAARETQNFTRLTTQLAAVVLQDLEVTSTSLFNHLLGLIDQLEGNAVE